MLVLKGTSLLVGRPCVQICLLLDIALHSAYALGCHSETLASQSYVGAGFFFGTQRSLQMQQGLAWPGRLVGSLCSCRYQACMYLHAAFTHQALAQGVQWAPAYLVLGSTCQSSSSSCYPIKP
jgi:hypothetical protein